MYSLHAGELLGVGSALIAPAVPNEENQGAGAVARANAWLQQVSLPLSPRARAFCGRVHELPQSPALSTSVTLPLQSDAQQLADFVTAAEILETIGNLLESSGNTHV